MKKIHIYYLAVFFCFCLTSLVNAQIKLTLVSEKTAFKLGEPVVVYVTATNTGNETVSIYEDFSPEMTEYLYLITGPDSEEQVYSPIFAAEPDQLISLGKGASIDGAVELFFGAGKYYFSKPGKYGIKVKYKKFICKPLIITVLKPASNEGKEVAKKILSSKQMGLYYELGGNDEFMEANKIIDDLAKNYSQYEVTTYFLQIKAKSLSIPARNFVSKKHRGPQYDEALKILNQAKQKKLPLFYQNKNAALIAKIYNKTDRNREAIKELESFKETLNRNLLYKKYFIMELNSSLEFMEK